MNAAPRVTKKPKPKSLPPAVPPFAVSRFTEDEYHKLIENGVLTATHRIELIHGWLVTKMTLNPPHNYGVNALMQAFLSLGAATTVRVQQPITTADSEPEPDVVLAVGSHVDYTMRNPSPTECVVVAEVADSSLRPSSNSTRGPRLPCTGSSTSKTAASRCTRNRRVVRTRPTNPTLTTALTTRCRL